MIGPVSSALGNGNGGIVPPWLQNPPVIGLPVEPPDDAELPVVPVPPMIGGHDE